MFDQFFLFYVTYLIPSTALIPLYIGFKGYSRLSKPSIIIFWFVFVSAVLNVCNMILMEFLPNTQFMLHGGAIIEFAMLSAFFACFFSKKYQVVIAVVAVLYGISCVVNGFYIQGLEAFNTYTRTLESLIIIIYFICFQNKQSAKITNKWADDSNNWLSVGILLYYASSTLMFAFANYLLKIPLFIYKLIWMVHCAFLAIEYILFAVGYTKELKASNKPTELP
ncbi:hypothetical protein FPZ43_17350 [Mucilaginibacter pallidiroseus]|uniref:Uncharacterized protein n=1 Tax=Mucilaginibacter pallidiroseus TaxID=2599295 RepID=A0A563U0V0_9SPHI|nr:hypothetical protein [Mucilaginibacter pallidiroseus]TWR25236.1 hypothetical protein FPZ43_17350 [Mucilaginibacter pallidiroseus]